MASLKGLRIAVNAPNSATNNLLTSPGMIAECRRQAAGIALDALGSTAFMRAVRSYEKPQMAAVYRTYLDFAELTPPLVYSVVLSFFGLGSVFATLGCLTAACALVSWRYLPRSL